MCACSSSSVEEKRGELSRTKGEWTHEQTEMAIDIYLDGLRREEEYLSRNLELRDSLRFFDERRCARDVLKARRAEIDKARSSLKKKLDILNDISQ